MRLPLQPAFWMGWTQKRNRIRLQIYAYFYFNALKKGAWKSFPKRPQQSIRESGLPPVSWHCTVTAEIILQCQWLFADVAQAFM